MFRVRVYCCARARARSRYRAWPRFMVRFRVYCSARARARSRYRAGVGLWLGLGFIVRLGLGLVL